MGGVPTPQAQSLSPRTRSQLSLIHCPRSCLSRDLPRARVSRVQGGRSGTEAAPSIKENHVCEELQSFPDRSSITHQRKQGVFLFLPSALLAEIQKAPRAIQTPRTSPLSGVSQEKIKIKRLDQKKVHCRQVHLLVTKSVTRQRRPGGPV